MSIYHQCSLSKKVICNNNYTICINTYLIVASEAEVEPPVKQEETDEVAPDTAGTVFKRPIDVSPGETFKRPRSVLVSS